MKREFLWFLGVCCTVGVLSAATPSEDPLEVLDAHSAMQRRLDAAAIDLLGNRWTPELAAEISEAPGLLAPYFTDSAALGIWESPSPGEDVVASAAQLGEMRGRLQHAAALEMLAALRAGNVPSAAAWRALIALPKYGSAVEGALALLRLGGNSKHQAEVAKLLARESILWQLTRAREKTDALARLAGSDRMNPALLALRASEVESLAAIPADLLLLTGTTTAPPARRASWKELLTATDLPSALAGWRLALEKEYPNLLTEKDIVSRERLVLKLLRLVPIEYQSGVRDGEIVIPIEYREAKTFAIQSRQILAELLPVWSESQTSALTEFGPELIVLQDELESVISAKGPLDAVRSSTTELSNLLQDEFGLSLRRHGAGSDIVAEAALEVRALLTESLVAAEAGRWRQAEAARIDAYVSFDLEIETRVLPRDPQLAMRAERAFLDGGDGIPGIKAAIDARLGGSELEKAYAATLAAVDECAALARVGLAPGAAALSAALIVLREGLEAVVILAALLAGLRGPENDSTRRHVAVGAWAALAASVALFVISRTLLAGLSRYGEILEAVISILAVAILLMVTNWVFHKYYWTGWNARLRELSRAAQRPMRSPWIESCALVGVGFMTIFREGFETTLFMQSLILEAGMRPALIGLASGGAVIAVVGFAVFQLGAKLPYRKMLMLTGFLVIFVLFTFAGSTVRILQTVGWMPIHPVPGLSLPSWMGLWLGLYPTWEGLAVPFLTFVYVGGAWLWVKFASKRALETVPAEAQTVGG